MPKVKWWTWVITVSFWVCVICLLSYHSFGQVHKQYRLTVDMAACSYIEPFGGVCQASVHTADKKRWSLMCNQKRATCVELTPGEDYSFEFTRCWNDREPTIPCIRIHGDPYDVTYSMMEEK